MGTSTITERSRLHELYQLPAPVLTGYLNPPSPGPDDDGTELRPGALLAYLLEDLRFGGATPEAVEALRSVLETLQPGGPAAAAFVGADARPRVFDLPNAELADQVYCAAVPHVLPLLRWRQQHPPFATVVLDQTGADLVAQPAGAAPPVRTRIAGPDDVVESAWQHHAEHAADDSRQHHVERTAEAVADALVASDAELLLVGGESRAEQYFLERLSARLHSDVTIKTIPDGSREHREDAVDAAVQEYVAEESQHALDRLQDRCGRGGLGVLGPSATIQALAEARVEMLLIVLAEPGSHSHPDDAATAWFGPLPTDISEHRTDILVPDGRPSHGPLDEVLARSAVLTEADIRVLPEGLDNAPPHGVGALCRFAVP